MPNYPYTFQLPPLNLQDIPSNGAVGEFLGISAGGVLDWLPVATGGGDMLKADNLSGLADYAIARTNIGLGTASTPTFANLTLTSPSLSSSAPVTISQTWDQAATLFTALKVNATSTNSLTTSRLLDLQSGGASKFSVDRTGNIRVDPTNSTAYLTFIVGSNTAFEYYGGNGWGDQALAVRARAGLNIDSSIGRHQLLFGGDTFLLRDGAPNTLALRNGAAAAQTFNVYGTYTSGASYARLAISCDTSGNATLTTQSTGVAGSLSINGVPVGLGKGNVSSNVAIGSNALQANTTGGQNSSLGFNALFSNTTGSQNCSFGLNSLYLNTTSGGNSSFGFNSLFSSTGAQNSAFGLNSLQNNTTGGNNSALGANSLNGNSSGGNNSGFGFDAGRFIADGITTNSTGSDSVFLGAATKALGAGQNNQIVIGYNATGIGSNSVVLGNDSITKTALKGNVGIGTTSPTSKLHVVGDAVLTGDLLGTNYTIGVPTILTQSNISITNNHSGVADSAIVITPKGTGGVIFGPKPDGTATGGNARGNYAVDLQAKRGINTQVASGINSFIAGGIDNTASGNYSFVTGNGNIASGNFSSVNGGIGNTASSLNSLVCGGESNIASGGRSNISGGLSNSTTALFGFIAGGQNGLADRYSLNAHAAGQFSTRGDAQTTKAVFRNKTTTNSAVELFLDGASIRYTITSGKIISMLINITGTKSDGSAVAHYVRQYSIKNIGGTTSEVYAAVTVGTDNAAGTSIALSADNTNDSLKIEVTGVASETWRWVASVDAVEVGHGI